MTRLSFLYVLIPILAMVAVLPPILELPPVRWPHNLNVLQVVVAAPFWLGVVSAPGYLYAWWGHHDAARLAPRLQAWVGGSLVAAVVASVTGSLVSIPAIVPLPFALGSSACSYLLLRRFYRSRRYAV
jgi:hypothetical protein